MSPRRRHTGPTGRRGSASEYDEDLARFDYRRAEMLDPASLDALVASLDRLDALVNNAGGNFTDRGEWNPEVFAEALQLHVASAFQLAVGCKPMLSRSAIQGGGSVVNCASMSAVRGSTYVPGYASGKAALVEMTRSAGITWARENVRVNSIAPGLIESRMTAVMKRPEMAEVGKSKIARVPMGRWGTPEDVASTFLFLASPAARFVTGQMWCVAQDSWPTADLEPRGRRPVGVANGMRTSGIPCRANRKRIGTVKPGNRDECGQRPSIGPETHRLRCRSGCAPRPRPRESAGVSGMVAGSGCKVSATADWLAVGGVWGEPVSGARSLICRQDAGKLRTPWAAGSCDSRAVARPWQTVFPRQGTGNFCAPSRERARPAVGSVRTVVEPPSEGGTEPVRALAGRFPRSQREQGRARSITLRRMRSHPFFGSFAVVLLAACSREQPVEPTGAGREAPSAAPAPARPAANPLRDAYFGAVHVHTSYSFDAFTNGTVSKPADAYEWAKGRPIRGNAAGLMLQIETPLDFYAVSDHAEMMGVFPRMSDPNDPLSRLPLAARVTSKDPNEAMQAFAGILRDMSEGRIDPALTDPTVSRSVWTEIVKTAEEYYEPGRFTTFPAFEWTSNPDKRNLHRVVVFRDGSAVPELAFSALDSERPEDLWAWMEVQRRAGATLLAIPHNGNASDGLMFSLLGSDGQPLTSEEIRTRAANEPLYEISQIKGTSETLPALSPNDEFAGFEIWDYTLSADAERPTKREGSYARRALLDGLRLAREGKGNPFEFGFIADSDTHNAAASNEEDNYTGKFAFEADPRHRLEGLTGQPPEQAQQVREFSSGGLAGVWAEANTREAIFDAMARRETFGTSGPHLRVRVFGGFDFTAVDGSSPDWVRAGYARGVPMGGRLGAAPHGGKPSFVVKATKDPSSGNLDRIQIVKGWIDAAGEPHEAIFDVAWSGDRRPDPTTGKLPPVGNTVDLATATYANTIGAAELAAVWRDDAFDPTQYAFYYVRALEIPTPRWSTRDAVKLGVPIPAGLPATIQERAWSSPIWYSPR